ncbi:uncharacterized protein LOC144118919 [Amblyomma americanum]
MEKLCILALLLLLATSCLADKVLELTHWHHKPQEKPTEKPTEKPPEKCDRAIPDGAMRRRGRLLHCIYPCAGTNVKFKHVMDGSRCWHSRGRGECRKGLCLPRR